MNDGLDSPLRVFLSHTSELASEPPTPSFVAAAKEATQRAGHVSVDMSLWTAEDTRTRELCENRVSECNVYVAILGFRYGTLVRDDPTMSHVELEYETATRLGLPRLVFFLEDALEVAVPRAFHVDVNSSRQETFKSRVLNDLTAAGVVSPDDLDRKLYQALIQLNPSRRPATGRQQHRTIYMVPPRLDYLVPRDDLTQRLVAALLAEENQAIALTTALQGAGGFGKTTLASEVCRRSEIIERFPDGILWTTIGEAIESADLAGKLNDLSEALSGKRPTFADPEQAGFHLGELLGAERRLLVIDDVWRVSQLQPFLLGGPGCVRLITTRNRSIIPGNADAITVDVMETHEARRMLSAGIEQIAEPLADVLLNQTGRWPVLMSLVNGSLRRYVRNGENVITAAQRVANRLRSAGPSALDITRPELRRQAVGATLDASLSLLNDDQLKRYFELSIFPEDAAIPLSVIEELWGATGHLDSNGAEALCLELADLSLVTYVGGSEPKVELHDVIRSFVRRREESRLPATNRLWLDSVVTSLAATGGPLQFGTVYAGDRDDAWWNLPPDHYLWDSLGYHLIESGRSDKLRKLLADLRWLCAKLMVRGPEALEADFDLVEDNLQTEPLHRAIAQASHLLATIEPTYSLVSILLSRLEDLDSIGNRLENLAVPRLRSIWPMPDKPDRAMRRVLAGHSGMIWTCGVDADGLRVVSAGDGGRVRVWDVRAGATLLEIDASNETIYSISIAPDGTWFATGGQDGVIRLWDLVSGRLRRNLDRSDKIIYGTSVSGDGLKLASCGEDGTIQVWDASTGRLIQQFYDSPGTSYTCEFGPGDRYLIAAGDDGRARIWDIETGRKMAELTGAFGSIYSSVFNESEGFIALAGYDGILRIWDSQTLELRRSITVSSGTIYDCCASPNGEWIATVSEDRLVRIWNSADGQLRQEFSGHLGYLGCCAPSPDGKWIVTGGHDRVLRAWRVADEWTPVKLLQSQAPLIGCATIGREGGVVTADDAGVVQIRHAESPSEASIWTATGTQIEAIDVSNDGSRIATAGDLGTVQIWRVADRRMERMISAHDGWALSCAFTPDGGSVVTTGLDGRVRLWDADSGMIIREFRGPETAVSCCTISQDGRGVAAGGFDGVLYHWDIRSPAALMRLLPQGKLSWLHSCCWLGASGIISATAADGNVYLWDSTTGRLVGTLRGHEGAVRSCSFSDTLGVLATCGDDKTLRIWDPELGVCLIAMRVESQLRDVAWIGESDRLIAVGDRGAYCMQFVTGD